MFRRVHRINWTLEFLRLRVPHYAPLARDDLHEFRKEIITASAGVGIAAASGLIFACFLSVAVIVSGWDSDRRTLIAWCICGGWGLFALAGLMLVRKAISGPPPFRLLSAALARDYSRIVSAIDREAQ